MTGWGIPEMSQFLFNLWIYYLEFGLAEPIQNIWLRLNWLVCTAFVETNHNRKTRDVMMVALRNSNRRTCFDGTFAG